MSGSPTSRDIRRTLLLCACVVLGSHSLSALDPNLTIDQYMVTRWGSRESLPGGAINAIAQTPDGYLWIGADNGLVRFDGAGFRLFDHANTPSMPAGHVLGVAVDSDGELWVRMESPYLLRYRGGKFEQTYPATLPPPFSPDREKGATAVAAGAHGDLLIAPPSGPLRYRAGKFAPVVSWGTAGGLVMSIAETAEGAVWIGMRDTGLFCVRSGRASPVTGLPDQKVNVVLAGAGLELWIGTDAGLVHWNGAAITHQGVPAPLDRSPILALGRDRDSNLWVATPAGIARLDSNGVALQTTAGVPGAVRAIFEDREGNLWFGGTKGLMQFRDAPFLTYAGVAAEGGSVYADGAGRTWIGPSTGGLLSIRGAEHHSVTGLGLERDKVYSISGGPGELWIGRKLGGITQLREADGVLEPRTFTTADGLAPGIVYAIHRARNGTAWAGTLSGAVSRIQNGRVTTFAAGDSGAVNTIEETPDGVIWAGTAAGLEAFRGDQRRKYSGEDGLPPGGVDSLAVDPEGVLWIGSSAGLFFWSGTRIESARNTPDSLQGEILGMAADNAGNLWAATNRSVVRISRASLRGQSNTPAAMREFGTADGLPSTQGIRRDHSVVNDTSGRIWFSLHGGLSVANPSRPALLAPALVHLESVAVDGHPLAAGPAARYSSSRQRVVFNFAGLSLADPASVRYRYFLEGYDQDWSQPTESRAAAYTNLPPSTYTFRVMASNSEGLWNGPPASMLLEVQAQVWQTWWFRLIGFCLVALVILAAVLYRLARVRTELNMRFETRLAERTRIGRELHDTLLQSFQGLMLRLQVVDELLSPGKAKEQLQQSLERADQAIAEARSAVFDLRSSAQVASDLAEAVRAMGEELVTPDSAAFHLVVEGSPRDLHPMIRDELYRIAREALRNAFNHARAHHIETEITYGERLFRLRIRDDGAGIPGEVLGQGRPGHYGLRGMRERANQIGSKLEIWSGDGTGTEIELSIAGSIAYGASPGHNFFSLFRRKAG